jgi:hypothetical protein
MAIFKIAHILIRWFTWWQTIASNETKLVGKMLYFLLCNSWHYQPTYVVCTITLLDYVMMGHWRPGLWKLYADRYVPTIAACNPSYTWASSCLLQHQFLRRQLCRLSGLYDRWWCESPSITAHGDADIYSSYQLQLLVSLVLNSCCQGHGPYDSYVNAWILCICNAFSCFSQICAAMGQTAT